MIAHQQNSEADVPRNRYSLSKKEIIKQADSLHADRIVLFKENKHIGINTEFVVEISRHQGKLFIAAFDTTTPESLMI